MKTLSIVIPVYYNSDSLFELNDELLRLKVALNEIGIAVETIFVDDGSEDDSLKKLLQIKSTGDNVTVVKLTRNFGSMHAIKTGFKFVTGDCFAVLPADLQDPPALIVEMAKRWLSGSKFVICERSSRDDPFLSKIFALLYYKLLRLFVMNNFPKGGYDLTLMDKEMLPYMVNSSKNYYMALLAFWLGYKPDTVYYHREKRRHGKSKWTFAKKFKAFIDIMLGFSVTPIRAISTVGLLVSLGSFCYGASVVALALMNNIPVKGYATIVALITFLLGLIILMLGIIGEYLWRIFDETNLRPETVIDEVY